MKESLKIQNIPVFNPHQMEDTEIEALSTGRDNLLQSVIELMKSSLKKGANQHLIIFGPRGMGKSFFTRMIEVKHRADSKFNTSLFIRFPEEQGNIDFVADVQDMISTKLEGGNFQSKKASWDISDIEWQQSKKRLQDALKKIKKEQKITHVFFSMENLQDFILEMDNIESGRMREFLELDAISLIGTSIRPDIDNNYNKRLFQVFQKIELEPWKTKDYVNYFNCLARLKQVNWNENQLQQHEARVKAIAQFCGGSPRLAVVISRLIVFKNLEAFIDIFQGMLDDLTPYYQNLTADIPRQSGKLFDTLIRLGENISQSQLAEEIGQPQKTISRSFNWLENNYYINGVRPKNSRAKLYFVRDRLYQLYYLKREIHNDTHQTTIELLAEFLKNFFSKAEMRTHALQLFEKNKKEAVALAKLYLEAFDLGDIQRWSPEKLKKTLDRVTPEEVESLSFLKEAQAAIKNSDHAKALDNFLWILKITPKNTSILELVAQMNIELSNYEEAINYYKKAIAIDNEKYDAYVGIGISYYRLEKYEQTIDILQKAIQLNSNKPNAFSILGAVYGELKKHQLAKKVLNKAILLDPDDYLSYRHLAISCFELGEMSKSLVHFEKALELAPNNPEAYLDIGNFKRELGDFEEAVTFYQEAVRIAPDNGEVLKNLGYIKNHLNEFEEALNYYLRAQRLYPNDVDSCYNLGVVNHNLGKHDKAKSYYRKAIELKPYFSQPYSALIEYYFEDQNISAFKKLYSKIPKEIKADVLRITLDWQLKIHKQPYLLVSKYLDFVEQVDKAILPELISTIALLLYVNHPHDLLNNLLDEWKSIYGEKVKILYEVWHYILNQETEDYDRLQPDIKIAVDAILNEAETAALNS